MRTFLQPGDTIDVVATGPIASGSFQVIGKMFGFAESAAVAGDTYALKVKGVFDGQPKAAGEAAAQGADLYWSATNSNFTTTAGSNLRVGTAAYPALAGDTTVKLRLSGHF